MKISYLNKGIYLAESSSEKGKFHTVVPKELYCSCKSLKILCKHLKEVFARLQDNLIGVT